GWGGGGEGGGGCGGGGAAGGPGARAAGVSGEGGGVDKTVEGVGGGLGVGGRAPPLVSVRVGVWRMPAREHVPGDVVVKVDQAWKDNSIGVDDQSTRDVRLFVGNRCDAVAHDAEESVLDDASRRDDGAA